MSASESGYDESNEEILSSTKDLYINSLFYYSILEYFIYFCIAFAIFVIGFLLIFLALNFLLDFVGINLTALVLSILYGLGLPQEI